jgi:ATPase family AAA domain-containing protein 2
MARYSSKRTLEEIANKSDSDDYDYSDHPVRTSRSSGKPRKKVKTAKKKRRRGSDDDDNDSEDDMLSEIDELSYDESAEEEDLNVERNARGVARRRAVKERPAYKEESDENAEEEEDDNDDEEEEDEEEEISKPPPRNRRSNVITLKIGKPSNRQPTPDANSRTRRSTRHNRDPSEDIYALTNSGRHAQTVEQGNSAPEPRTRRASKSVATAKAIQEEDENDSAEIKASQLEVLESDIQGELEESLPSFVQGIVESADVEMADDGVIPESDNEAPKAEDEDNQDNNGEEEDDDEDEGPVTRRRNRPSQKSPAASQADDGSGSRSSRKRPSRSSQRKQDENSDFEPNEESDDDEISESGRSNASPRKVEQPTQDDNSSNGRRPGLRNRKSQSRGRADSEVYVDEAEELAEELEDLQPSRRRRRTNINSITYEDKPRRSRKDVDYRLIRPDLILPMEEEEGELAVNESPSRRGRGGGAGTWQRTLFSTSGPFGGGGPAAVLGPPGAPGAITNADSDSSDDEIMQVKGGSGAPGGLVPAPGSVGLTAQAHNADAAAPGLSGTPANFGKVKDKQALADADPLGIDPNVNFDSVGGLQAHIDQLKEMVALPLLYPEIFLRFHIVPPRGVLFHGPPGTGKTLMARALASSVSSEGRKVTFYMRKGADALSKWVGEAERQLRLLFEEARKTQPSIIFFDEIDGMYSTS